MARKGLEWILKLIAVPILTTAAIAGTYLATNNTKETKIADNKTDIKQKSKEVYDKISKNVKYDDDYRNRPNGARTIEDIANGQAGECTELTLYGIHELQKQGINAFALDVPLSRTDIKDDATSRHTLIGINYEGNILVIDLTKPSFGTKDFDITKAKKLTNNELQALWHNNSAFYLAQNGKTEEAFKQYEISLKLSPQAQTYHNRGTTHARTGNLESAIQDFNEALKIDDQRSTTWYNLGTIYSKKEQYEQAEQAYTQAAKLDETNTPALKGLGYVLIKQEKYEQAIQILEFVLKREPNSKEAQQNLEYAKKQK